MRKTLLAALLLSMLASSATAALTRRRAVRAPAAPPGPCEVRGLPNFYYSDDGGKTLSRNAAPPAPGGGGEIAVFADEPNRIVTASGPRVFDSTDSGCTWTERFTIPDQFKHKLHVVAASGGRAFYWTEEFTYRYDDGVVIPIPMPETIGALGVDGGNRDHIRILGVARGTPYESFDGGATWKPLGGEAGGFITAAVFHPNDINHIVVGVTGRGVQISRDGGKSWTASSAVASNRLVCEMAIVPKQPNVIWIETGTNTQQPSVIRSADGGVTAPGVATMTTVDRGICLPLVANPHDSNLAYIAFRQLYTFDAVTKTVTPAACCGSAFIQRISHSPVDPDRVYFFAAP